MPIVLQATTMARTVRRLTAAGLCALQLSFGGCTEVEHGVSDAGESQRDAGTDSASVNFDAAPASSVDASVDLHFLMIAVLLEVERSLIARCPCLTAAGEYDSSAECLSAVSLGRNWIDCANRVDLSGDDSDETRENLRCNIAELSLRTECLSGSSCAQDAIAMCMTQSLGCAVLPYELIAKVVGECTITLSR